VFCEKLTGTASDLAIPHLVLMADPNRLSRY
jgi:hypothetical protein